MKSFTLPQILAWGPCWDPTEILTATGQAEWTALELWEHCRSDSDRVWVATRPGVLACEQLLGWLSEVVARAIRRVPHPASRLATAAGALQTSDRDYLLHLRDTLRVDWSSVLLNYNCFDFSSSTYIHAAVVGAVYRAVCAACELRRDYTLAAKYAYSAVSYAAAATPSVVDETATQLGELRHLLETP